MAAGGGMPSGRYKRSMSEDIPLKDRMYSTWYRFRYGWQFRSSVAMGTSPVWLLGRCYHATEPQEESNELGKEGVPPHIILFLEHYTSLTWMTYRTNFSPISDTLLTSDCGWGCMVRSGQMLLATALHYYLLNRDWRLSTSTDKDRTIHTQILSWFADSPQKLCPFSLHSMMTQAETQGYRAGDWYGPSQVANLISHCVRKARSEHPPLEKFLVYLAHDCTVYVKDVEQLFDSTEESSLLLLVPVRLGGEALNPIYIPCVQNLLSLDHCVGIIGGKPRHSVYFVGFQDDKLIHLDPHYCQMAVDVTSTDFDIGSYHCKTPRKLTASKMDPSCTIGFFCSTKADFENLRKKTAPVLAPPKQKGVYPFFTFSDMSLGDVIDNAALGRMDISTVCNSSSGSRSHSNGSNMVDHGSQTGYFSDEDFIVVDCRTSASAVPSGLPRVHSAPGLVTNRTQFNGGAVSDTPGT